MQVTASANVETVGKATEKNCKSKRGLSEHVTVWAELWMDLDTQGAESGFHPPSGKAPMTGAMPAAVATGARQCREASGAVPRETLPAAHGPDPLAMGSKTAGQFKAVPEK